MNSFSCIISLSFISFGCGLSLFFSSLFFYMSCGHVAYLLWVCIFSLFFSLSCLVGMWHTFFGYASFISFCIAHIIDDNFRERESWCDLEFYFVVDGNACYLSV